MSYVWIAVSQDEYELPIAVADSGTELAEILGIDKRTIFSTRSHYKDGTLKSCRYHKIEVDDD